MVHAVSTISRQISTISQRAGVLLSSHCLPVRRHVYSDVSGGRIERWQPDHQMSGQSMYMFILNQAFNTLLFYYCCSIKQWKQFRALPPNKLHKFHKCHKKINLFCEKRKKRRKKNLTDMICFCLPEKCTSYLWIPSKKWAFRKFYFYMQMMQGEYFREYRRSQMETFHSYKKKSVNVVKESRFTSLNY